MRAVNMTKEETINKEVVLRFNEEVIEKANHDAIIEIIHPDFINHTAPQGSAQGQQGIIDFFATFHKAITDIKVEIFDQVVRDNKVVTRKAIHGIHSDALMGIAPSGKKIQINIIDIVTLEDGRYTDHWSIRDMQDLVNKASN
jgi:predicted ester cyclase